MGYRLSNEVLDHAPEDLTPAERLVLSVLAGYVVDEATRECYPGLDKLVKRTGLKPDSLRKVFQRLAARGLDPRVSIGVDKKGRNVFAHESVRTTYRIPKFERRDEGPATEAGSASPHLDARGGTVVPKRRDDSPSEGGSASPPKDLEGTERSLSPHLPQQTTERPPEGEREISPEDQILAAYAQALGRPVVAAVRNKIHDQAGKLLADGLPLWWLIGRAKELPDFGTDLTKHCEMSRVPVEVQRPDGLTKPCTTHPPFSRMIPGPDGDLINCPACHPDELARQLRQGAA